MYSLKLHKNLDTEKWSSFTLERQIFMIANEFNRLINAIKNSFSYNEMKENMERIFELIDMTVAVNKGNFRKELLRLRDLFAEIYLFDESTLKISQKYIELLYKTLLSLNSKTYIICK